MNTLPNNPYSTIPLEELHVLTRRAHQERAEVVSQMAKALVAWVRRTAREAGAAARMGEAPKPYGLPRTRTCG